MNSSACSLAWPPRLGGRSDRASIAKLTYKHICVFEPTAGPSVFVAADGATGGKGKLAHSHAEPRERSSGNPSLAINASRWSEAN